MARAAAVCAVCVAVAGIAGAAPARAAAPEPDLVFLPHLMGGPTPPPDLWNPCGAAVDSSHNTAGPDLYLANYHRHSIEAYDELPPSSPPFALLTQLWPVDPIDGPCGLALAPDGVLYVNNYHRNVERYVPAVFPLVKGTAFGAPTVIDSSHPTGVALDPVSGSVYVNVRTHLTAYDSGGAPLLDGGDPLRIGVGSLGDGYGAAVSAFPGTAGRIYVPDYADNTVKVYDPLLDVEEPVQTIEGADIPGGGFGSLRDSAVAVDRVTGEVYVADSLAYPQFTEYPEAVVHVFDHAGGYEGRLKHNTIDPSPVGLAVDNSTGPKQGRVYVTSGNSIGGAVYIYPPGSATSESAPPLVGAAPTPLSGDPGPSSGPMSSTSPRGAPAATQSKSARAGSSVIEQRGNLRVTVEGRLAPKRLPRRGVAPIKVSVGGQIATTDRSLPPQLKTLEIELNRHGRLDRRGLPSCRYEQIQPGSSKRALSACRSSLVGTGSFEANIILAGQDPYPSQGKLLVFNATEKGKPVLYGHIHTARPFATSFVIVFELRQKRSGRYGTTLFARIPRSMDSWGRLTALEMTLGRNYRAAGQRRSYISAGCPAPAGFPGTLFPLARTTFAFKGGKRIASTLISECKTRR